VENTVVNVVISLLSWFPPMALVGKVGSENLAEEAIYLG
jgi:hypothetical protein